MCLDSQRECLGYLMIRKIGSILVLSSALLSGCVTTTPDKLQTGDETSLLLFKDAFSQNIVNKKARWGGVIADITHEKKMTRIEVSNFALKSYGKPIVSDESDGRFYVYTKQFLDPIIYKKGRSITALGEFKGLEPGKVGEYEYEYPTLVNSSIHIWKEVKEVQIEYIDPWPFRHYPYGIFHRYGPVYKKNIRVNATNKPVKGKKDESGS